MADRGGLVRTESLGKLGLSRSADFVSRRRRFGTLVRRGDMGFRKDTEEGGGEGEASITFMFECAELENDVDDMLGNGARGLEEVDEEGSISGSDLERPDIWVFNWKSPEPLRIPPGGCNTGAESTVRSLSDMSGL